MPISLCDLTYDIAWRRAEGAGEIGKSMRCEGGLKRAVEVMESKDNESSGKWMSSKA
jgi:hypothetical protein